MDEEYNEDYICISSCNSSSLRDNVCWSVGSSVCVQQVLTKVKTFKIVHKAEKGMFTVQDIICDACRCI